MSSGGDGGGDGNGNGEGRDQETAAAKAKASQPQNINITAPPVRVVWPFQLLRRVYNGIDPCLRGRGGGSVLPRKRSR